MAKVHRIRLTEGEGVKLINHTIDSQEPVHFAFGPGWVALEWEEGTPPSPALEFLLLLRGISNENTEGGGI